MFSDNTTTVIVPDVEAMLQEAAKQPVDLATRLEGTPCFQLPDGDVIHDE